MPCLLPPAPCAEPPASVASVSSVVIFSPEFLLGYSTRTLSRRSVLCFWCSCRLIDAHEFLAPILAHYSSSARAPCAHSGSYAAAAAAGSHAAPQKGCEWERPPALSVGWRVALPDLSPQRVAQRTQDLREGSWGAYISRQMVAFYKSKNAIWANLLQCCRRTPRSMWTRCVRCSRRASCARSCWTVARDVPSVLPPAERCGGGRAARPLWIVLGARYWSTFMYLRSCIYGYVLLNKNMVLYLMVGLQLFD